MGSGGEWRGESGAAPNAGAEGNARGNAEGNEEAEANAEPRAEECELHQKMEIKLGHMFHFHGIVGEINMVGGRDSGRISSEYSIRKGLNFL
jgi:hypothetical protein